MREERRRNPDPISRLAVATFISGLIGGALAPFLAIAAIIDMRSRQRRGMPFVVTGLAAFVTWAVMVTLFITSEQERLVSDLDIKAGDCFVAPYGTSGNSEVLLLSCTSPHTGEAFAVLPLPDGPYPRIVELYDDSMARCQAKAPAPLTDLNDQHGRIQVLTPTPTGWQQQPHRVVCYFHFAYEVTQPANDLRAVT